MASTSTSSNPSASTSSNTPSGINSTANSTLVGGDSRWYFTSDQLANSPSRKQGIDADEELSFRQMTAYLIQEMGQRLQVSQLCINTAIVYMHRFYAFHSFSHFHRNGIAAASLFLAAKVEEQPRKLEHVIKAAHLCLNQEPPVNNSDVYAEQAQDLVFNENVLLQTLGFDVAIDHPHTHVVKTCHLVKACKDLAQTSYFLASNSLHLTSMCLQYRPTVVACFCIYLACKWSRWEIPQSTEGKHWFHYVDKSVTMDLLQQLTNEFIAIYEKSPARLKSKLNSVKAIAQGARFPEPSRNVSDASNGSSSSQQIGQVPSSAIPPQSQQSSSSTSSRRTEPVSASHSSHHRPHHAGVQHPHHHHHHHHHSKHANAADIPEHKQQTKPYPNTSNNSHVNRPRSDRSHQQPHLIQSGVPTDAGSQYSSSKQMAPSKSNTNTSSTSGRSGMPQISNIPGIVQNQQSINLASSTSRQSNLPTQLHEMGYHKNRVNPSSANLQNQLNPQLPSNHKTILAKSQPEPPNRSLIKDQTGVRDLKIPIKHSSVNSNNSSSNNNLYSQPQQSVGLDMTRNVLQQQQNQKGYVQNVMPGGLQPPTNYQQPLSSRNSSSNSNSNNLSNINSGNKYEQTGQQQSLLSQQHQQKQTQENSSYVHTSTTNTSITAFSQNSSQHNNDHMDICSPPRYSTSQNQVPPAPIAIQPTKPFLSIFSPDYNEKQQQLSQQLPQINSNTSNSNKPIFNNKISRDSPKKEKRSGTPKKDKRSDLHNLQTDPQKGVDKRLVKNVSLTSNSNSVSMIPMNSNYGIQQQPLQLGDFSYNTSKRTSCVKMEEDVGRETKVRKIEQPTVDVKPQSFLFDHSTQSNQAVNNLNIQNSSVNNIQESNKTKIYPSTINGIETNPDLVSSLLKESLCNENKYVAQPSLIKTELEASIVTNSTGISTNTIIKTEPKLSPIQSGYNINPMETLPQELLQNISTYTTPFVNIKQEPNQYQQSQQQSQTQVQHPPNQQIINEPQQQSHSQIQQQHLSQDDFIKSKSEKKKKKEKHKHKEKDKSKDKEERKKHKKDKDKHKDKDKDRERNSSAGESSEPVKLKISKEKLNLPPKDSNNVSPGQLKIKIPKDRIKTEINSNELDIQHGNNNQIVPQMPLKIKISKDKIGSFGHDNINLTNKQHSSLSSIPGTNNSGNIHPSNFPNVNSMSGSSSSSKKKDRDKDREKKKSNDSNKHNGSGGNTSSGGISGSTTSSKSSSSKIQYSQLFGDSNDEDDDDTDNDSIPHHKQQQHQQQRFQQIHSNKNYLQNSVNPNSITGIVSNNNNNNYSNINNNNNNHNINNNNSNTGGYQYSENKKLNINCYNNSNPQHQYQQNYK